MAKANAAFKLPKTIKRILAVMPNKHQRAEVKKIFIDAEITSKYAPKVRREKSE